MNAAIVDLINVVVNYATEYLMPLLLLGFLLALVLRLLITVSLHRQKSFVKEFNKRVHKDINEHPDSRGSFYYNVKRLLTRTYFETFELRERYKRRSGDRIMSVSDRVFLVQDGVAPAEDVDRLFKTCFGHKMGPLETGDLIGLDTILDSLDVLYESYNDNKFRPCPLLKKMVHAGLLGRKSGEGFYRYTV